MFKGPSKGRAFNVMSASRPVQKVPLKGLFSDGTWKCNCDPRLPAQRFQTKNGGQNHGRWFYKCQRPQHIGCGFFLWEDDAKLREEAAVLNNSRTEPLFGAPHTPAKSYAGDLMTPEATVERSGLRFRNLESTLTPYTPSKSAGGVPRSFATSTGSPTRGATVQEDDGEDEFFDWPGTDEQELSKVASQLPHRAMPPPETPRKAAKTELFSTPGKRGYNEMASIGTTSAANPASSSTTLLQDDDIFTTPATTNTSRAPNLFTNAQLPPPAETPTHQSISDFSPGSNEDSDLTTEILNCLASQQISPMTSELKDRIRAIGNRHSRHMRGVTRGRDVSRAQIVRNNETIAQLRGDIAALQADRETNKTVIHLLTRELESEKGRGR